MTAYRVLCIATITGEELIEAETAEDAIRAAKAKFNPTGEAPQTFEVEAAIAERLQPEPLIRGFRPDEICQHHDMPFVRPGMCPACLGAMGGN